VTLTPAASASQSRKLPETAGQQHAAACADPDGLWHWPARHPLPGLVTLTSVASAARSRRMPDVPQAVRLLLFRGGGLMIGHGWAGPVTGIWCATRRSVMGSSHTSAYSGPPSRQAHPCGCRPGVVRRLLGGCRGLIALLRLGDERGAAFRRHVAPCGERGGPAAGKLGGAFWPARPDKVRRSGWLIARQDYEAQRSGAGCLARCMTGAGDRACLEVMWPSCRGSAGRPLPDRGRSHKSASGSGATV
jgi:hypothetical protein